MPATLAADPPRVAAPPGGSFLIRDSSPSAVLTPEDFSEIQHQIRATTRRFMDEEVNPQIPALERQDPGLMRALIRQSGELGLLGVLVPEHYDGLELDITTQMLVCECIGTYASFSTTYGGHAGIGTMPIVFFGTEQQKEKYLPRLVAGEILGAYCLSEPHAGSDSLASRTRAELTPDGRHYVLNGQKMWISNGGWADLYTVFAKVDGERFTAFLVERAWEGVKPGAEEHKMGLRGSSTTALYLDDVRVPVENVLGEVGRGHVIAFNVLNMGRLELAAACVGGAKDLLGESARYAMQRRAFGQPIGHFGAIRQKLGDMAMETFAGEALTYRTAGMIDARLEGLSWEDPGAPGKALKAIEEYAIECSIAKVYLSEALDHVADEAVSDPWRLRIPPGLRCRARIPGLAHQSHLRGHQRDQPHADGRNALQAGRTGKAGPDGSPGRVEAARSPRACGRPQDRLPGASRPRRAGQASHAGRRATGKAAARLRSGGEPGGDRSPGRHDDGGVRRGVRVAARGASGGGGRRRRRR